MNDETQRDIGRLQEAVETLKCDMHGMREDVATIKELLAQARGGWRVMLAVGSAAGAVGAGFAKIVAVMKGGS